MGRCEFRQEEGHYKIGEDSLYRHQSSNRDYLYTSTSKMKTIVAFAALVAVALAAPQGQHPETLLVKETPSDNIGVGGYNYGFELSDGQSKQETAEAVEGGSDGQFLRVRGSFTFVDPLTNVPYTVSYVADENGFHPVGDHLPKA